MVTKTIVFEGGEGSGKGTAIALLAEYLRSKGKKVCLTREPGGTKIGEQIREVILDSKNTNMTGLTEVLLFAASRAQVLTEIIQKAIDTGEYDYIIIDRYVYSSYVYQGIVRGIGLEKVKKINDIATNEWHPDVVIYLDLDPEIGLARISQNNREVNRLDKENMDFHKAVRAGYLKVSEYFKNFKILNANQSVENVLHDVLTEVEKL